jgi:hypothetical protein
LAMHLRVRDTTTVGLADRGTRLATISEAMCLHGRDDDR